MRAAWILLAGATAVPAGAQVVDSNAATAAAPAAGGSVAAPTGADGGLEEIVVTAERRETNLQDTPIAVTALTAAALEAQGVRQINDLGASVPNLTTTTGPQGSGDANFFVRGVGQYDFIVTNDPGVGVYVDGVYLGRTVGAMLDSSDIARIEVLRGPQGTLFGRNTLGGAVSITSEQPSTDGLSARLRGTYGSRDRIDVDGSVNAPLGDNAALRVGAFTRNQDGFATRVFDGARFGRTERYGGRAQLLLRAGERLTVTLSGDYALDKSNPAPSVNRAVNLTPPFSFIFPPAITQDRSADFYTVFASNSPESRNEIYGFSGTVALDLGAATLKSITAWRKLEGFSTSDPDGTGFRLYDQNVDTRQEQFSQELQLSGSTDFVDYLLGGYYFRERAEQVLALCFAPITPVPTARFNPCNTWTQGNNQLTKSYAVFGQARLKLSDSFSVTLGGRYTWEEKDIVSNQFFDFRPAGTPFNPTPGAPPPGLRIVAPIVTNLPGALRFERFTPKLGAEYKPSDDVLIFASYAKGFRSGGFNGRLIAPQPNVPIYAPDTNDSFEVGIKSDLLDNRLRLNVTGFYSKYKGIQQTISDPSVQFRVANAGDAELSGFEAEATALPIEGLRFNLGVGYTHSKFVNVPVAVGPINGNSLPFSPRWTVATGLEYAIPAGRSGATVTPRVDYRFQSLTYFSAFNLPLEQQEAYGLLSARITFSAPDSRFSIAAYGENLTQERYYTFGQNALGAQGVAYSYLGRPREFGVTAGVRF